VRLVLFLLLLLPWSADGHGVFVDYDQYGLYVINPTNHWHVCTIGMYQFEVSPQSRSRSYPPAGWGCY